MQEVTERREIDAPAAAVREALADRESFMRAGGFDEATVDGDRIHLANSVGLLTIELELEAVDEPEYDFVYRQVEGIFESMVTRFTIEGVAEDEGEDEGEDERPVTIVGTTEFALNASLVGPILDATIIKRQRRRELAGHFDYVEATATATETADPVES